MSLLETTWLVDSLLSRGSALKELGQHFLTDDTVLDRAVELAEINEHDHVLEIGPGPGTLTQKILATGARVTAIELDENACEHLTENLEHENLNLIQGDALREKIPLDLTAVVANIPYQISSPLIDILAQHQRQYSNFRCLVLLLQEEFAVRLCMSEGISSRGSLGMTTAIEWKTQMDLKVPPNAFVPQPKVNSRLVRLLPHDSIQDLPSNIPKPNSRLPRLLVGTAFLERRKKMRNRLKHTPKRIARVRGWHAAGYREVAKKIIENPDKEGLPLGWLDARPEQLDLEFWLALAGWMQSLHNELNSQDA